MYRATIDVRTGLPDFKLINSDIGYRVTAAGYSVSEQMIYALDYNTLKLLKIDVKGKVEVFPVPLSLDTTLHFFAGEVSPAGGNLMVVGRDKTTMRDKTLFSIRLFSADHLAGRVSILNDFGNSLEDLAFDPIFGTLYGYNGLHNKLVWIDNLSGKVTDYFSRNMSGVGVLGTLFFDRNGNLHGYGTSGGSEESTFFDIDKWQGKAENSASTGPTGRYSDGCTCPYTIQHYKTVSAEQLLPCNELTVTYDIINQAGTAYSYLTLTDTFPLGFIIKKIKKMTRTGEVVSGEGSNVLFVKGIDAILDTNRVIITLGITDAVEAGNYANQAVIKAFPGALGGQIFSDNPATAIEKDPTAIEVIGRKSKEKLTKQQFLCNGNGVLLKTTVPNAMYRWSNGSTTASILAQKVGWYSVTVTTDCGDFIDSTYVTKISETLQLKLPSKISVELGAPLTLEPAINKVGKLTYQWLAADKTTIACPTCLTLVANPRQATKFTLTVTDEYGCQALDSVEVEVLPVREIYAPTAFSPNNDGVNDIFYLQSKYDAKIIYLRIFDRWGNQVFEVQNGVLNNPNFGWDGKTVSSQTFIYVTEIEFLDGAKKRLSGEVSLLK